MAVEERRKLLKSTFIVGGAVVGTKTIPGSWTRPIINTVVLPAHAETSPSGEEPQADAQCDDQQVAGGDEPDTRTIELGASSGNFDFQYDTLSRKDRIIVRYEGTVLFDTGCVGESDTVNLSYSGTSTQIEVEVEPNCELGGTGTLWFYTVFCPT